MSEPQHNNLKAFDYTVALIFAKLFESFPEHATLDGMKLVIEAAVDKNIPEDVRATVPKIMTNTVDWLRDEGFIRYAHASISGTFAGVTLTMRGLTVLGYMPVSLSGSTKNEPLIDKLRSALKAGGSTALHEVVKQLVGKSFGLLVSGGAAGIPLDV